MGAVFDTNKFPFCVTASMAPFFPHYAFSGVDGGVDGAVLVFDKFSFILPNP